MTLNHRHDVNLKHLLLTMKTATVPRTTQRRHRATPQVASKRTSPGVPTAPATKALRAVQKYRNYRKYVKDELL